MASKSDQIVGEYVYRAKLAEQAQRFSEMVEFMKKVAAAKETELSTEERNLLSIAYKNVVGQRRASWKTISSLEAKEKSKVTSHRKDNNANKTKKHETQAKWAVEYRLQIEKEMAVLCHEVIEILKKNVIPKSNAEIAACFITISEKAKKFKERGKESIEKDLAAQLQDLEEKTHALTSISNGESLVFYFKMIGDYNRYLAEFTTNSEQRKLESAYPALISYYVATEIAKTQLQPTHPIRLGLALNFSVFYYEIMSQPDRACTLAKNAFDEAVAEMEQIQEETYKDSTLIMKLLRDNLIYWTSDLNDNSEEHSISITSSIAGKKGE